MPLSGKQIFLDTIRMLIPILLRFMVLPMWQEMKRTGEAAYLRDPRLNNQRDQSLTVLIKAEKGYLEIAWTQMLIRRKPILLQQSAPNKELKTHNLTQQELMKERQESSMAIQVINQLAKKRIESLCLLKWV